MSVGGHFKTLDIEECKQLLREGVIGRVGWAGVDGQTVLPVSYVVENDLIVFRTWAGTQLASLADGIDVCFEVDYFDSDVANGWSVLVRGRAARATEALTKPMLFAPSTIDPQIKHDTIAIQPTEYAGRAVAAPADV